MSTARDDLKRRITDKFTHDSALRSNDRWWKGLDSFSDEGLSKLHEVASTLRGLAVTGVRTFSDMAYIQGNIERREHAAIDFYYRHRKYVHGGHSFIMINEVLHTLSIMGIRNDTEELATLDAHLEASSTYVPLDTGANSRRANVYANNKHLIKFVERHPDRVAEIMSFRAERGFSRYSDMERYFKAVDALDTPAIMDGWL